MIKYKCVDEFGITGIVEVEGRLFVTKDKNGKDVFAGDRVKFYSGVRLSGKKEIKVGTVIYKDCQFKIDNFPLSITTKFLDIELIEDKGE